MILDKSNNSYQQPLATAIIQIINVGIFDMHTSVSVNSSINRQVRTEYLSEVGEGEGEDEGECEGEDDIDIIDTTCNEQDHLLYIAQ